MQGKSERFNVLWGIDVAVGVAYTTAQHEVDRFPVLWPTEAIVITPAPES
jgi:hypothetical protein